MADIQYLNYGDQQIEQQALLNNLADQVQGYVSRQSWSNKRKEKFMNAYTDLMNRGIRGASNSSGKWMLQVGGDDLPEMSKKDREMYQEAAYFIQQQMASLPTKSVEEKEDKSKLPVFDNKYFTTELNHLIGEREFGGRDWDTQTDWNSLDKRNENGIRGRKNRATTLANYLKSYADSLDESKLNFEGSPFTDLSDFRSRIQNAINALNTDDPEDDIRALNAIGLRASDYLNDGSGDLSGKVDANGNQLTYSQLAEYNKQQAEYNKQQAEQEQMLKKQQLQQQVQQQQQQELQRRNNRFSGAKEQLNAPRQLSEGLQYEDYARIGAALGDVISLGGFGANVVGSIVSLFGDTTADIADDKLSTWDTLKNFGRNLGWTFAGFIPGAKFGKIGKNLLRWAPKLAVALNDYNLLNDESSKKTWNKLNSLLTAISNGEAEEVLNRFNFDEEDLKNITYWVRAFTGNINAVKSTARDIKYSKARGTQGQKFKTKSGQEVELTNKEVNEINSVGARKGQKAAEQKFKEITKQKTGVEHELQDGQVKFSENGRRGFLKDSRSKIQDQRLQGESVVFRTPEQQKYYNLLQQDRSIGGYGGWRPLNLRGTSSYFDHFDSGFAFKNPLSGIRRRLDPYSNLSKPAANNTSQSTAKQGNQLKKKGWLKQGGTIDKTKIQQYKEFINK